MRILWCGPRAAAPRRINRDADGHGCDGKRYSFPDNIAAVSLFYHSLDSPFLAALPPLLHSAHGRRRVLQVEVPAYLLMQPLGERLGRRRTWAGFLAVTGGSLLLIGLLTAAIAAGSAGAPAFDQAAHHHQFHHHHHHHRHEPSLRLADDGDSDGTAIMSEATSAAGAAGAAGDALAALPGADPPAPPAASPDAHPLLLLLALLARSGGAGCSALCYVAAAEQFPTGCRNSAIGFGAACGRAASILAPVAVNLLPSPFFFLSFIAAVAALAALALPETAGKPITELGGADANETAALREVELATPRTGEARTC